MPQPAAECSLDRYFELARGFSSPVTAERGSGSIMVLAWSLVLIFALSVSVVITGWLGSARKGRNTVDLTALAVAGEFAVTGDENGACLQGRRTASSNGGELTYCNIVGGQASFVAEVSVKVPLQPSIGSSQLWVGQSAKAGTG